MPFKLRPSCIAALGALLLPLPQASAQWAPDKTVKIITPFAPGGTADVLARLVSQYLSEKKGQPVVVEARPGGGSVVSSEAVARATPDGTTLLLTSNAFVIAPVVRTGLTYDPITSFAPICNLAYAPTVIAVQASSPYGSLKDLLDAARAKPGAVSMASVGPASALHVAVELLKQWAKADITYVPFPGGAPAVTSLLGGHITSVLANYTEVQSNLGRDLRPLAVGARRRIDALAGVPTLAENGFTDIEAITWFVLLMPAGTPQPIADKIVRAVDEAINAPELKPKLAAVGLVPVGACGAAVADFLPQQAERYRRAIHDAGIKAE